MYHNSIGIEHKGMTFDHDRCYAFPLSSSFLKKREEEKENELAKIVIKVHAFLLDLLLKKLTDTYTEGGNISMRNFQHLFY